MKVRFHTYPIILTILLSLLFSPSYILKSNAFALSIEDEKTLGRDFLTQIRRHFELVDDDFTDPFINKLGHYLISPLETKHFPFNFYVIKDNTLNAFAGPGGRIFIFSGLVDVLDSVDELAAIICHEIGHVSARHLAKRIQQSKKIGLATLACIIAGMFLGGKAAGALITGSMAAGIQTQLSYSRDDERQADQLGFKYMQSAGFDPAGMLTTLKKIEKGSWLGTDKVPTYLLTHPCGPERMSNLDTMLSTYSPKCPKVEAARFSALFPLFKTVIRAKCLDSHDAERLFSLELKKTPGSDLPHLGLGIVYKERAEYTRAIYHLKKALETRPDFVPILTTIGKTYQMNGQDKEAVSVLEKALKLDKGSKSALFLLGVSYENLEQYEKAIHLFERLASLRPVKKEVYYHLGLSYGRHNRLALAHYNFGLYFKRLGQPQKARFHFRKADSLCQHNPDLRKKIRRETDRRGTPPGP